MGALVIRSADGRHAGRTRLGVPLTLGPRVFAYEFEPAERDRAERLARELTHSTGIRCMVIDRDAEASECRVLPFRRGAQAVSRRG